MIGHLTVDLKEIISLGIVGLIGFFLWKTGRLRLRTVIKIGYVYKQGYENLRIFYKKFHGVDEYYFRFTKGTTITLAYEVSVEEGELHLQWGDRKNYIWSKVFTQDGQGTIVFTAKHSLHSLIVSGTQTKGGCRVHFTH